MVLGMAEQLLSGDEPGLGKVPGLVTLSVPGVGQEKGWGRHI